MDGDALKLADLSSEREELRIGALAHGFAAVEGELDRIEARDHVGVFATLHRNGA